MSVKYTDWIPQSSLGKLGMTMCAWSPSTQRHREVGP